MSKDEAHPILQLAPERTYRQTGRLVDKLGVLAMAADARLLVGHLRYATHGEPSDMANNHPHPLDGAGWCTTASSATMRNWPGSMTCHPVTACDSEVLGLLADRNRPRGNAVARSPFTTRGELLSADG